MPIDFARNAATQIGTTVFRKVAGDLNGVISGSEGGSGDSSSPAAPLERTKFSTKNLAFPLDLQSGDPGLGNHGHYMMFFINQNTASELSFGGNEQNGADNEKKAKSEYGIQNPKSNKSSSYYEPKKVNTQKAIKSGATQSNVPSDYQGADFPITNNNGPTEKEHDRSGDPELTKQETDGEKIAVNEVDKPPKTSGSTLYISRPASTRLDTAITLYMPPQVSVAYGANYSDTPIGSMTKAAVDLFDTVTSGKALESIVGEGLDVVRTAAQDVALTKLLGLADGLGFTGAKAAYEIGKGQIVADRMELAFQGINKRKFSYTFKMMPRNEAEAIEIKEICRAFRYHMLPEFADGDRSGRRLITPNTFNIQYMYLSKQNKFLDPISECVLTNMAVSYGGERFRTFDPDNNTETPPPVETSVQLEFAELELITRDRIQDEEEQFAYRHDNLTNPEMQA